MFVQANVRSYAEVTMNAVSTLSKPVMPQDNLSKSGQPVDNASAKSKSRTKGIIMRIANASTDDEAMDVCIVDNARLSGLKSPPGEMRAVADITCLPCQTKDGDPSHIPDCSTIKDMLTPSANDDVEYDKSYRDIDPNVVAQRWTHTKLIWNLKPSMH